MVNCRQCRYYYITWDKKYPYGCRSMGLKSHQIPSIVVYKNSGKECLAFQAKDSKKQPSDNRIE